MNEWSIVILNEIEDGYIISTSNGDTQYVTYEDYKKLMNNRKKLIPPNSDSFHSYYNPYDLSKYGGIKKKKK